MERILCAAIWYDDGLIYPSQPKNIGTGYVWCGRRHHNIINLRGTLLDSKTETKDVQGFITNTDRFVGREEAREIASQVGQIDPRDSHHETKLFSEDLY